MSETIACTNKYVHEHFANAPLGGWNRLDAECDRIDALRYVPAGGPTLLRPESAPGPLDRWVRRRARLSRHAGPMSTTDHAAPGATHNASITDRLRPGEGGRIATVRLFRVAVFATAALLPLSAGACSLTQHAADDTPIVIGADLEL